jgi:uncharacterized protein (TIGR00369 family)
MGGKEVCDADTQTGLNGMPTGFEPCTFWDGEFGEAQGTLYWSESRQRFAFRVSERHRNANGGIHGGMLMTLADQVLGITVVRAIGNRPAATVSLNCDLVAGAMPGDLVEGTAEVTRITRSIVFVQGTLFRGQQRLLSAAGSWKPLLPLPPQG